MYFSEQHFNMYFSEQHFNMYFSEQHFNMYFWEPGDGWAPVVVNCREESNFILAIQQQPSIGNKYFYVGGSIFASSFRHISVTYYSYSPNQNCK